MHFFKEFTLWFRAHNELPRCKQRGILKSIEHPQGIGTCLPLPDLNIADITELAGPLPRPFRNEQVVV